MKFTEKYLKSLKPSEQRYDVREDSGLILRVSKDGTKTFSYVYKIYGKTKRITIGGYPSVSLADARAELARIQSIRHEGRDPALEKKESKHQLKATPTLSEFADEFINRWAKPNKKSWKKDKSNLDRYVIPFIGDKKITNVTRRDIIAILDPIRERGAEVQANRVYACIRRMMNFAVERGVLETSPATHIKVTREWARDRVLSRDEILMLIKALNAKQLWIGTRLALEMILRTAQRSGEIRLMSREEIDTEKMIWTIPAEKSKNGMKHTVPLTNKMISIIDVSASTSNSNWIFASPTKIDCPISEFTLAQSMRKALYESQMERTTPHDLRRTAATYISEIGFNRLVIDKLLNHKDRSVGGIYDRHSYNKEKRDALVQWNDELEKILYKNKDDAETNLFN